MKLTSRNNDHPRSDDGRTDIHTPIPRIDSAHPVRWVECKSYKFRKSSRNLWKLTSIVFLGLAKRSLFYSKANLTTGSFIWLTALVDIFQIFCLIDKTSFLQQYIVFFVVFDNKRQSAFCHPIIVLTRSGCCSLKYFKGISREICGKNISSPLSSFFSIQLVKKPFDNLLAFQNCFLLPPVGRLQT